MITEGIRRFQGYDMKLCKVQSNSELVRQSFPSEDKGQTVKVLGPVDLNSEQPEKRSTALGLQWDIQNDTYRVSQNRNETALNDT